MKEYILFSLIILFSLVFVSASPWGTGILSYYNLDDTTGVVIDKIGNFDGTNNGAARGVAGKINNSFDFEAGDSNDNISIGQLNLVQNFSVNAWVKLESTGVNNFIIGAPTGGLELRIRGTTGGDIMFGRNGIGQVASTGKIANTNWHMVTTIYNGTYVNYYVNGTFDSATAYTDSLSTGVNYFIGHGGVGETYDGLIDELGIWNRTLTSAEVTELWNSGSGRTYPDIFIQPLAPNGIIVSETSRNFTANYFILDFNFTNTTYYIWNSTGLFNNSVIINITGTENSTNTNISNLVLGDYTWNVYACYANSTFSNCSFADYNNTFSVRSNVSNYNFNSSTYETSSEKFEINITDIFATPTNTKLFYNGTEYSATLSNLGENKYTLSRIIDIPLVQGNKTFYFQWNSGGFTEQSNYSQIVNQTIFSLCNSTISTKFLNITFKDEVDNSKINATIPTSAFVYYLGSGLINKTYSLINNTANYEYVFCAMPNKTFNVITSLQYAKDSYPQRIWQPSVQSYSNITTNQILYLLSSSDGIYVTFQVLNPNDQPVSGVTVSATREISEVETNIGVTTTSTSGLATLWVNPDFLTTVTFSKTGFSNVVYEDYLTQSSYTITFGGINEPAKDYTRGISISLLPKSNELFNDTEYFFEFNVTSSYWDLDSFGFSLRLANGSIIGSDSSTTAGTPATISYNVNNQSIIYMDYYWTIEGNQSIGTRYWIITNTELTDWSIKAFFTDLTLYLNSGMFGIDNFGRYLIIFLILFISVGIMSYKFGMTSPMSITSLIFAIVFFFDIIVGLIPEIRGINHLITYVAGVLLIGTIISEVYR